MRTINLSSSYLMNHKIYAISRILEFTISITMSYGMLFLAKSQRVTGPAELLILNLIFLVAMAALIFHSMKAIGHDYQKRLHEMAAPIGDRRPGLKPGLSIMEMLIIQSIAFVASMAILEVCLPLFYPDFRVDFLSYWRANNHTVILISSAWVFIGIGMAWVQTYRVVHSQLESR